MSSSRKIAGFFAVIGVILAVLAVWTSFHFRQAIPKLIKQSDGVVACANGMLTAVCDGRYEDAGQWIYGNPSLTTGAEVDSEAGRMIWAKFVDSLSYELVGEPYTSELGVCQNVRITGLDYSSITDHLKERSQALLTERVEAAVDVTEIYDEENNYREDFVMQILRDATEQSLAEDARNKEVSLTLNLIYEGTQWWIIPDLDLMNAISGGVMG